MALCLERSTQLRPDLWQISTADSAHFAFNCYVITAEKTALIHTGKPSQFLATLSLLKEILLGKTLDYVLFSHVEADECGALAALLHAYPQCQVVCNKVAAISLKEMLQQPPLILTDQQVLDLGAYQLRLINTPHFPHNWDGHLWYETQHKWLFSSDYCSLGGIHPAVVDEPLTYEMLTFMQQGGFIAYGSSVSKVTQQLAQLPVSLIATMHGPATQGEACNQLLRSLHNAWLDKGHAELKAITYL